MPEHDLLSIAEFYRDQLVSFCQRLIRTPSPPGEEGEIAQVIAREMQDLGYDDVWTDKAGNVIGVVRGTSPGKRIILNAHMDHVDPGDPSDWPSPPFSAAIRDGCIWGRGALDDKGPLATQVYAAGAIKRSRIDFAGEVYVVGVVMEEVGGLGTRSLVQDITADFAILGESTGNLLALGHRGCVQVLLRVKGKSVHASVPSLGVNPHYVIARFLLRLENLPMRQSPIFGSSTVAPTIYRCDQSSGNVIPGEAVLYLDWRNVPEEGKDQIVASLSEIMNDSLIPGAKASLEVPESELVSYKGLRMRIPSTFPSYALPADHPLVQESLHALRDLFGPSVGTRYWSFATDGGHLFEAGIPTIGYAPGDDRLAHTVQEHIEIDAMVQALAGNIAIAKRLGTLT